VFTRPSYSPSSWSATTNSRWLTWFPQLSGSRRLARSSVEMTERARRARRSGTWPSRRSACQSWKPIASESRPLL